MALSRAGHRAVVSFSEEDFSGSKDGFSDAPSNQSRLAKSDAASLGPCSLVVESLGIGGGQLVNSPLQHQKSISATADSKLAAQSAKHTNHSAVLGLTSFATRDACMRRHHPVSCCGGIPAL
jgi:hypothetical protein